MKLQLSLLCLFFLLPGILQAAEPVSRLQDVLLESTDIEQNSLRDDNGQTLWEIAPVNLPTDPHGDNNHFGWPVATALEGRIIVVHRAMPGHNVSLSGHADRYTTYSMILSSRDGGQTWSKPYDIRDCMTPEARNRGGSVPLCHRYKFSPDNTSPLGYKLHLNAIGTTRKGNVILVSDHGVFRSSDTGDTWQHLETAFREDHHTGPIVYVGPRIIDHPTLGLLLFGHHVAYDGAKRGDIIAGQLAVYQSRDEGESWKNITQQLPDSCLQAEPNAILHQSELYFIARNQDSLQLMQIRWKPGTPPTIHETNMRSKRSVDTSDLVFNPVTERFEVIQSNRTEMSVNLFSLASENWEDADWRFEACLLNRGGDFYRNADGFHTGGAVLDQSKNQQHIFIYAGAPGGPAGVFRISRTLATPQLVQGIQDRKEKHLTSPPSKP
ncbi:sialidase family protein [Rubinisphaera sp. JC750]|uniref:sialidase family protein n=1 Tax=Rubinisphaera sp. JC750 TaxID=2898658 RepID=UPI001F26D55F|nr:sialidase family protein [Rubinisphaera sp. JC750]